MHRLRALQAADPTITPFARLPSGDHVWIEQTLDAGFTGLIIRTVLYFNPLKVFYPVAAVIAVGLAGSLYYDLFVEKNLGDKTVLLFVALVQVLSIGLIADLIDKKSRMR